MNQKVFKPWIMRRGRWHIYEDGKLSTLCGVGMAGRNYTDSPVEVLHRCPKCHELMSVLVRSGLVKVSVLVDPTP